MEIKVVHLSELKGLKFRIPSYQRGYRWERKHIERLLDDLLEFSKKVRMTKRGSDEVVEKLKKNLGFSCLQPIVVVPTSKEGNHGPKKDAEYDVIDGQQRLTTIYLIMSYLGDDLFSLCYETRENDFFEHKRYKDGLQNGDAQKNIDFYYLSHAYKTIEDWFKDHESEGTSARHDSIEDRIYDVLYQTEEEGDDPAKIHDTRFIWYEVDQNKAIDTFNNLNYGKIGLTASELVKALLFESDDSPEPELARREASSRSHRWSVMEDSLHDKYFWGMLGQNNYSADIHLELILNFVARNVDNRMDYSTQEGWKRQEKDWLFNIFSKAIYDAEFCDENGNQLTKKSDKTTYLWNKILETYGVFHNWYADRLLFHKIGFLMQMRDKKADKDELLKELYDAYNAQTKTEFNNTLKSRIGKVVAIRSRHKANIAERANQKKNLDELRYYESSDEDDMRRILLLFNVMETCNSDKAQARFPFMETDKLISLEHIHPQHMPSEMKYAQAKEWYIHHEFVIKERLSSMKNILQSENDENGSFAARVESLEEAIEKAPTMLENEEVYNKQKDECLKFINVIDREFDELVGISEDVLHSISNMALVDNTTNIKLSNKLLIEKRKTLKECQQNGAYIPDGTWNVFNKFYSDEIVEMKYWSSADRENYFKKIKQLYEGFVGTDNVENNNIEGNSEEE